MANGLARRTTVLHHAFDDLGANARLWQPSLVRRNVGRRAGPGDWRGITMSSYAFTRIKVSTDGTRTISTLCPSSMVWR